MTLPLHSQDIRQVVCSLAEQVRRIETGWRGETGRRVEWETVVASGIGGLDRLLPDGGFRRGTLVEWLAHQAGSGAGTLALGVAARALAGGGALVVVDRRGQFHAPPAIRLGIERERLIVVRPTSDEDHAWAFDQVLRTRGVAAVWGEPPPGDDPMFRRWQLAAETSGTLGLLLRDLAARDAPGWAELRLVVTPLAAPRAVGRGRRVQIELARARGGRAGGRVEIEIPRDARHDENLASQPTTPAESRDDETRDVHLASSMAAAETSRKARRRRRA
jgi:protein ImuA